MMHDQTTESEPEPADLTPDEILRAGKERYGVSNGEVMCGHCETNIPKGDPLHWPAFPISQYDDTDAICTPCVRDILNTDWVGYGEAMGGDAT